MFSGQRYLLFSRLTTCLWTPLAFGHHRKGKGREGKGRGRVHSFVQSEECFDYRGAVLLWGLAGEERELHGLNVRSVELIDAPITVA